MMVKASPGTAFEMVQAQVGLRPLKVLFDVPAGTAELQASGFRRWSVKMSQVIMIRIGVSLRPVDHKPGFLQVSACLAQAVLEEDWRPCQACRLGLATSRYPGTILPGLLGKRYGNLRQCLGWRGIHAEMTPDAF
jgi:hypothetical protein